MVSKLCDRFSQQLQSMVWQIVWQHNGSPVKKSKDIEVFFDNGRCSIVIQEIYLEDGGEYVCTAKNDYGSAKTSCRLIVERKYQLWSNVELETWIEIIWLTGSFDLLNSS